MISVLFFAVDAKLRRTLEQLPKRDRDIRIVGIADDQESFVRLAGKLFLQDLANVEAGIYPLPVDHDGSLFALIRRSRIFFDDLPNIHRRREGRAYSEALNETTRGTRPVITCRTSTINLAAG